MATLVQNLSSSALPDDRGRVDTARWTTAHFISAAGVPSVLAEALLAGREPTGNGSELAMTIEFARGVESEQDLAHKLHEGGACERIARLLLPKLRSLALGADAHALAPQSEPKFCNHLELQYSGLDTFFGGLEKRIGAPNPKVAETMEDEHTQRADSDQPFRTGNYGTETTSRVEFAFVTEATPTALDRLGRTEWPAETDATLKLRGRSRQPLPLQAFDQELAALNETLLRLQQPLMTREEVVGGRLYTGPMFSKYNAVLRGRGDSGQLRRQYVLLCAPAMGRDLFLSGSLPFEDLEPKLNSYTTTLHAINSVVVKSSKLTVATRVYRGLSGAVLPAEFFKKNEFGVAGGVETGFMSTTTCRDVAMGYASGGVNHGAGVARAPGIVFEIPMGMVDRGANIAWLSQYPHEREILCGPLSGLEVMSYRVDGSILVIEMKLSINLASLTMEQVICKRRKIVQDMCEQFVQRLGTRDICGGAWRDFCRASSVPQPDISKFLRKWLDAISGEHPAHYNEDSQLAEAIRDAVTANACLTQWPEGFAHLLRHQPNAMEESVFKIDANFAQELPAGMPTAGIAALTYANPRLRELRLDNPAVTCKITSREVAMLAGVISHAPGLQLHTLSLCGNDVGPGGFIALAAALGRNTMLTSLDLNDNPYTGEGSDLSGVAALSAAVPRSSLLRLNLDGTWLHLQQLRGREPTPALDLSRQCLRVGSVAVAVACIARNTCVTSLDLSGNILCTEGVRVIAEQLDGHPSLTSLDLSDNAHVVEGELGHSLLDAFRSRANFTLRTIRVSSCGEWSDSRSVDRKIPRLPDKRE